MKIAIVEALAMLLGAAVSVFGAIAAIAFLWACPNLVTTLTSMMVGVPAFLFGLLFFGTLSGLLIRFLVLIVGIALVRGRMSVGWVSPGRCTSFISWASHSWRFFGRGRQQGERLMGFEVALHGVLNR